MKLGTSEVAKLLKVDRDLIKTWAFRFADYLGPLANPAKGATRQFVASDLSVLAYVSYYWEDHPDIENIKYGLNAGENDEPPFNEIVTEALPFFIEPPEGLDESWRHGALRGSMGNDIDRFSLAEEYKLAGDLLVRAAIDNGEVNDVLAPIVYNYRHATELYLKSVVPAPNEDARSHDLNGLLLKLKSSLNERFNSKMPPWFENLILAFHQFDPGGTSFRYEGTDPFAKEDELWVDVSHLRKQMDWLAKAFRRIKEAQETN